MNTTVYELKQYYVAAGGQAEDVADITTIPDMIAAITALGAGGSSSLPEVTAADNGKVLAVVEGAWDKASGGALVVTFTENDGTWSTDKTKSEIIEALESGRTVYGTTSTGELFPVAYYSVMGVAFLYMHVTNNVLSVDEYGIAPFGVYHNSFHS